MERRQVVVSENGDGSLDLIIRRIPADAATGAMLGQAGATRHRLGDDRPGRLGDTVADIAWRLPDTPFVEAQRWLELFVALHERVGIDAVAAALRHLMPSTLAHDGEPARTTAVLETLLAALQRPATPTPAQEASGGGATPPADADPDDTPRCEVLGADLPSLAGLTARRSNFETVPEAVASILDAMADSDAACRALGGISRQRLSQRISAGEVLAVRRGKRAWRLPREQFRDGAVLPGVAEVIARRGQGWPAWRLLTTAHPLLAGETGFARLAHGDVVSILKLADMLEGRILRGRHRRCRMPPSGRSSNSPSPGPFGAFRHAIPTPGGPAARSAATALVGFRTRRRWSIPTTAAIYASGCARTTCGRATRAGYAATCRLVVSDSPP